MKIALYYPWIYLKGGVERSLLELVTRSRHEYVLYTSHYQPENTFPGYHSLDVRVLQEVKVQRTIGAVLQAALTIARQKVDLTDYEVFAVWCDGLGPLSLFRNHSLPAVNICSTPLRPVYDPVYESEAKKERTRLGRWSYDFFKVVFRALDRHAWKHFEIVVSTSQEVTQRIVQNGLCSEPHRLRMAYPGVDTTQPLSPPTYEPFFLIVGRIMWTKNIQLALEAFLQADLPDSWQLVIAGFVDQKSEPYAQSLLARAGDDPRIKMIRNPEDEVLADLYARTSAVLFPPLNEDWGIVPLEAMLRSKAVVANASGGPKESIQPDVTGLLLQPRLEEWTQALETLAYNPEQTRRYGLAGRERVKRYDWSEFVTTIDAALQDAAEGRFTSQGTPPRQVKLSSSSSPAGPSP